METKNLFHYIQDRYIEPHFVVDVTEHWDAKVESIKAFKSQFLTQILLSQLAISLQLNLLSLLRHVQGKWVIK